MAHLYSPVDGERVWEPVFLRDRKENSFPSTGNGLAHSKSLHYLSCLRSAALHTYVKHQSFFIMLLNVYVREFTSSYDKEQKL